MFLKEADMSPSVTAWLRSLDLIVRAEFVTPSGMCDLVGLRFNAEKVACRIALKQRKQISSVSRAALLLHLPDIETRRSMSLIQIADHFRQVIPEEVVSAEIGRLIEDGFVRATARGRLQKLNGWMPLQERLVAVELKLSRVEEALQQAQANLSFAPESFVAFPIEVARRIEAGRKRWKSYFDQGVGLLGVRRLGCDVLIEARDGGEIFDPAVRMHCVEKFWRQRPLVKGN